MNLFGVFVCVLFVAEALAARSFSSLCPQIRVKFGRVRYKARGKIARFLCNTGYMLAGDKYSTCDVSGKWDTVTLPKCVSKLKGLSFRGNFDKFWFFRAYL